MSGARLRTYVGLAAAIVPFAIVVHLVAEAAAVGRDGLGLPFVVRHAYFGILFIAAATWFGATAGIGCGASERRRRASLLSADLRGRYGKYGIATLAGANVGFFALTQAIEGVPVAAGAMGLSLVIALAGSIGAALAVFFFGYALAAATIESVIGCAPRRTSRIFVRRARTIAAPRHATATYSLLRPNRPPPIRPCF